MSSDIWMQCAPKFKFRSYKGAPWRVVEAQHIISTRKLVDSEEEQLVLEEMIDEMKPIKPYDRECEAYHYLLWTPFRYPPLLYGSRLGSSDRRGIWYGSENISTAFAEKAYYMFLLRSGSHADFGIFEVPITVFCAHVSTQKCADLTRPPFQEFEKDLISPISYQVSQKIGSALRDVGAEAICFRSARCLDRGYNLAITKISAFKEHRPRSHSVWFCMSSDKTVEFKSAEILSSFDFTNIRTIFHKSSFEMNKKFMQVEEV